MPEPFPVENWDGRAVTFRPNQRATPPSLTAGEAALVFAFDHDRVVLARIARRGWCIPGGRIEPGETAETAARREAIEEAGITLGPLIELGTTVALQSDGSELTLAVSFIGTVLTADEPSMPAESDGICRAGRSEVAAVYYRWDKLMAAMFAYAWRRSTELTASGT